MNRLIAMVFTAALCALVGCKDGQNDPVPQPQPEVSPVADAGTAAVVIGMEKSFAGNCPGANLDAKRMNDLLSKYAKDVYYLTNEQATHDRVASAMKEAATHDLCIIYYSGHGGSTAFADTGSEEADGRDEYLCVYDKMFRDNEIWSIISNAKGRVLLIFDCCHSKTMFRVPGITLKKTSSKMMMRRRDANTFSMLCWSGCPDDAYSYGSNAGGEFTNCLLAKFAANKTYEYLWNEIAADKELRKSEIVQKTEIGTGFVAKPVFK